jgi:hypothetical protein
LNIVSVFNKMHAGYIVKVEWGLGVKIQMEAINEKN